MDEQFFCGWLQGFENGLNDLDAESRSLLLRHCAKQCADTGVLQAYRALHREVEGNRDEFYRRLGETGSVRGEVVIPGRVYRIRFPSCACDLHAAGVQTPCLCECSRQSILYVGESVWADERLRVETEGTILGGAAECCFKVTFLGS